MQKRMPRQARPTGITILAVLAGLSALGGLFGGFVLFGVGSALFGLSGAIFGLAYLALAGLSLALALGLLDDGAVGLAAWRRTRRGEHHLRAGHGDLRWRRAHRRDRSRRRSARPSCITSTSRRSSRCSVGRSAASRGAAGPFAGSPRPPHGASEERTMMDPLSPGPRRAPDRPWERLSVPLHPSSTRTSSTAWSRTSSTASSS